MNIFENTEAAFKHKSNAELKKAYWLFKAVESPLMTKLGNFSLKWGMKLHLPMMKSVVKETVFEQFCGGETIKESLKTIDKLYENKVCSILDYSVEGKDDEKEYDHAKEEILRTIEMAKITEAIPFVVFKPTGFGEMDLYEKIGKKLPLKDDEKLAWARIVKRFDDVCKKSYEEDVTVMIDAEESWMQDAADDLAVKMMKTYNQQRCIVVNTLQMYRHDRLEYLKKLFEKAEKEDFKIGFKVVRGAYMEKERNRAEEKGYPSPIQPDKASTDKDYNAAIEFILKNNHRISLFAGTHNEHSCQLMVEKMQQLNIAPNLHKMWFGQLLGMSDNISFVLAQKGYNVAKYVPYGPVKEVIPYLMRRANENTSVAGQSGRELTLLKKEIDRRKSTKKIKN